MAIAHDNIVAAAADIKLSLLTFAVERRNFSGFGECGDLFIRIQELAKDIERNIDLLIEQEAEDATE